MNAANVERKPELEMVEDMERHDDVIHNKELLEEAFAAETHEHSMTVWQAAKSYPAACIWAFIMAFTIVMESFDMFLIGNFVALPAFYNKYGVDQGDGKGFVIPTRWQTSLSQAGQIGAFLGVFLAPLITNRLGYRWTALIGLMLMNATIFISFFADSLPVFLIGQLFEGIPWGCFISISPASEIVPIPLRGAVTATLQMSWAIGSIIVGAATYVLNQRTDEWAYRIPLAIQWIFPTPLMVLIWFAPESPWWLVRHGRPEEALKSITRLGRRSKIQDPKDTLAMMARTVEIEAHLGSTPTYLDLVKGSDFRRTAITCLIYASQNLVGNLIAKAPPQTERCRLCGHQQPDMFHAESCRGTQGDRKRRHEVVKFSLGRALARTPGSEVIYEPIIIERDPSQARYNDIRYSGSMESGLRPMEFDVKVLGVGTTNHGLGRPLPPSTTGLFEQAKQRAAEGLKKLADQTMKDLPENIVLVPGSTFHPFVISAGGLTEAGTTKVLDEMKKRLPPGAFSFMTQVTSIGLQRRRVEAMMRVEGGGVIADERRGVRRGLRG